MTEESQVAAPPDDDPDITDNEVLYRRLSYDNGDWVVRDARTGGRVRPTSGAFNPDPDGVSVYRETVLIANKLSASSLLKNPEQSLVSFTVGHLRGINLGIKFDPWPQDVPDPDDPCNVAHSLIVGLNALTTNPRIKRQRALARVSSMKFVDG